MVIPTRKQEEAQQRIAVAGGLYRAMQSFQQSHKSGDSEEARGILERMVQDFSREWEAHNFAVAGYLVLGDKEAAFRANTIGMALNPDISVFYCRLAKWLREEGKTAEAERVLENGWERSKRLYPRKRHAEERERFFSLHSSVE